MKWFLFLVGLAILYGSTQVILADTTFTVQERTIFLPTKDWLSDKAIVFLHGSPGSRTDFDKLITHFPEYDALALDFPGFGNNPLSVDDFGTSAGADYLLEQLNYFNISSAHIVGYSWGGGVAQQFAARYPERTDSLILYASMGVIEAEATGTHIGEQIRYAISYPFVVWYPGSLLLSSYRRKGFMRSFMDTDLRETPNILSSVTVPSLIVHGEKDTVIPLWTAERHNELLQNSTLIVIPGGHGQIFSDPTEIARAIRGWLNV